MSTGLRRTEEGLRRLQTLWPDLKEASSDDLPGPDITAPIVTQICSISDCEGTWVRRIGVVRSKGRAAVDQH
jgi:hypothetical protein